MTAEAVRRLALCLRAWAWYEPARPAGERDALCWDLIDDLRRLAARRRGS